MSLGFTSFHISFISIRKLPSAGRITQIIHREVNSQQPAGQQGGFILGEDLLITA